jgi:hypothetical protein
MTVRQALSQDEAAALAASGLWFSADDVWTAAETRLGDTITTEQRSALWAETEIALMKTVETCLVDPNPPLPLGYVGLRVSPYRVYKLGPTLKMVLVHLLVLAITKGNPLTAVGLFRTLLQGYEHLSDPDERDVFEALAALQGRPALSRLGLARPSLEPTPTGVTMFLDGAVSMERVTNALQRMDARGIVSENHGAWAIRL